MEEIIIYANNITYFVLTFCNKGWDTRQCQTTAWYASANGVTKFEPKIALTDNSNGLSFYRKIAEQGQNLLNPNGYMVLETGGDKQYKKVEKIFIDFNYSVVIHNDQNNENRFLEIHPKWYLH